MDVVGRFNEQRSATKQNESDVEVILEICTNNSSKL